MWYSGSDEIDIFAGLDAHGSGCISLHDAKSLIGNLMKSKSGLAKSITVQSFSWQFLLLLTSHSVFVGPRMLGGPSRGMYFQVKKTQQGATIGATAEHAIVGTQAKCSTQENAGPPTTPCRIVPSPRSEANHNARQFARLISANKIPLEATPDS